MMELFIRFNQRVRKLNDKGSQLGNYFSKMSCGFSDRFDTILEENIDIVKKIIPSGTKL
jgi:hypothetical protein